MAENLIVANLQTAAVGAKECGRKINHCHMIGSRDINGTDIIDITCVFIFLFDSDSNTSLSSWADPRVFPNIPGNTQLFWYTFICVYTHMYNVYWC